MPIPNGLLYDSYMIWSNVNLRAKDVCNYKTKILLGVEIDGLAFIG